MNRQPTVVQAVLRSDALVVMALCRLVPIGVELSEQARAGTPNFDSAILSQLAARGGCVFDSPCYETLKGFDERRFVNDDGTTRPFGGLGLPPGPSTDCGGIDACPESGSPLLTPTRG